MSDEQRFAAFLDQIEALTLAPDFDWALTALELVETERVTLRADPPAAWRSPVFRPLYLSSLVAMQQRLTEFISRGPEMEEPARTDLAKFLAGWIAGALKTLREELRAKPPQVH